MISSKNFLIYGLICLAACSSPKKDKAETIDSLKTDSIASVEDESDYIEGGSTFDVDPSLANETLTIFGKSGPMIYWLNKVYKPDHWINLDSGNASYKIKSADLIEDEYSDKDGKCVSRSILKVVREMPGEEYYDLHFLYKDADGNLSSEKVSFDGDIAQTTASISMSTEYKLSDNCPVLTVLGSSEGGDIGTVKVKDISFFISTETGMELVFDLILERTETEYRNSPEDEEKYTSEFRDFETLNKKTNGLRDIKVHTALSKNGEVYEEKDTIFRFDGDKYSE